MTTILKIVLAIQGKQLTDLEQDVLRAELLTTLTHLGRGAQPPVVIDQITEADDGPQESTGNTR